MLHAPGTAVQFRDTFPDFEDRKARLAPSILRDGAVPAYRELETGSEFPLALITPATHRTINSMFGEFNAAEACVRVHPDDAAARRWLTATSCGCGTTSAHSRWSRGIDADLRPGVVSMPKGLWRRDVPGGLTANASVPDTLNDLAGRRVLQRRPRRDRARQPWLSSSTQLPSGSSIIAMVTPGRNSVTGTAIL